MRGSIGPVLGVVMLAALAGGCDRRSGGAEQGNVTAANAAALNAVELNDSAVSADEVKPGTTTGIAAGAIDHGHLGQPEPAYPFRGADGKTHTLAEFRGHPVLVNLWATWCGPCVKEMPTLDALATREAGRLHVVAISQDSDAAKVSAFVADRHFATLSPYADPDMHWLPAVTSNLPTSILYDSAGKEVWRVQGDMDWTGDKAKAALADAR